MKLRAIEVTASSGETIIVHEPRMQDIGLFLKAMPSLMAIGRAMQASQAGADGVIGVPVDLPDTVLEGVYPLFGVMCNLTADEFKALPLWDGLAVLTALNEFVPNPTAATRSADSAGSPQD